MRGLLLLTLALLLCGCAALSGAEKTDDEAAPSPESGKSAWERLDDVLTGRVPRGEPVDPDWFSDAAFVGDSVSVMLRMYNDSSHALGDPAFFCAESLSPRNAMAAEEGSERLPEWPRGTGKRPKLPEGIAEFGAKKIYFMLGMNSISGGVDKAAEDLVTLIGLISEKSPEADILIQPVTPMTADSPRADDLLNNGTIRQYDRLLTRLCRENGWYYVDSAQALTDENGFLRADYSGDKAMGIHLNFTGAEAWADYLLTHVPQELR